ELDPARAEDARHNARVYGVEDRIEVHVGDACALVPRFDADLVFIDPPWGEGYDKRVTTLASLPLLEALLPLTERFARRLVKVPASFETRAIEGALPEAFFGLDAGDQHRIKFVLLGS